MYQPPFTISDEMLTLVAEISERIGGLNVMMTNQIPHPMLRKENRIKTIQSSLAIENNTLSIEQVTAIMEGKRVLGPLNEIQEVKGAIAAYDLLAQWRPIFAWIPIESMVKEYQQEYYEAIASSDKAGNSSAFILFMLQCIRKTIDEIATPKKTPKDIVLELIASDAKVTVEQMAEALGMNKRNAQKHINQLVNDGVIVRIGANRGGHWEVVEQRK